MQVTPSPLLGNIVGKQGNIIWYWEDHCSYPNQDQPNHFLCKQYEYTCKKIHMDFTTHMEKQIVLLHFYSLSLSLSLSLSHFLSRVFHFTYAIALHRHNELIDITHSIIKNKKSTLVNGSHWQIEIFTICCHAFAILCVLVMNNTPSLGDHFVREKTSKQFECWWCRSWIIAGGRAKWRNSRRYWCCRGSPSRARCRANIYIYIYIHLWDTDDFW